MEESVASAAPRRFGAHDLVDAVCLVVAVLTAVLVAANVTNPVHALAAVCFTVFVPGRAIVC